MFHCFAQGVARTQPRSVRKVHATLCTALTLDFRKHGGIL